MSRRDNDVEYVLKFMPDNTIHEEIAGRDVFTYKIKTSFNIVFKMAAYFDPELNGYCVQVIEPYIEDKFKTIHSGHIFPNGCICFGGSNSNEYMVRKTLAAAYAKSCLWAEGISIMLTHPDAAFVFSSNNNDEYSEWVSKMNS